MKLDLPYFDNRVTGVEAIIDAEGRVSYNTTLLKKSGSNVEVESSVQGLTDLNNLLSSVPVKNPLILSIKGKGIIHKKISANENGSFESLLDKVLPNSSIEDFYVQSFYCTNEFRIVSIARKTLIDSVLNSFLSKGYKLIQCFLGPFSVQAVLPLLYPKSETSAELKFSNHELLIRDGVISNYIPLLTEEPSANISAASMTISPTDFVSFSSAFSYFNPVDAVTSSIAIIEDYYKEYKEEIRFNKSGVIALSFFFVLLLVNFILFSFLSDEVKSKSVKVLLSSSELNMVDSMNVQLQEKMLFFSKSGLSEPSRTSFYADQIAKDIPVDISLSKIEIQPLKKNNEDENTLQFENKKILISGKSQYSMDINEWIKQMRKSEWINTIALLTYNQKESDKPGEFLIEIKLK